GTTLAEVLSMAASSKPGERVVSTRKMHLAAAFCPISAGATACMGGTLAVPGDANIFGAGHLTPPQPGGFGAGTLPPAFTFTAGAGHTLTVTAVSGCVGLTSPYNDCHGPDGSVVRAAATDITSYGGISGIQEDTNGFLVGLFLG